MRISGTDRLRLCPSLSTGLIVGRGSPLSFAVAVNLVLDRRARLSIGVRWRLAAARAVESFRRPSPPLLGHAIVHGVAVVPIAIEDVLVDASHFCA